MVKADVILAFPPFSKPALVQYAPFGVFTLAAYLRQQIPDIRVAVRDYTIPCAPQGEYSIRRWADTLRELQPDVVGISIITLNCRAGFEMARIAKEVSPLSLVVMGGIHAVASPSECLNVCDAVATGDGEEVLCDLVRGTPFHDMKGLIYRRYGYVVQTAKRPLLDLDILPVPAYDLTDLSRYPGYPAWHIITSRGCPYRCTFCTNHLMWAGKMRSKSVAHVVDEIAWLHETYGVTRIQFQDDTVNIPQDRAFALCDEIIDRGLNKKMAFMGSLRLNRQFVSQDLFYRLHDAGFDFLGFGVESGAQRVLDQMNKQLTPQEVRDAVRMARKAEIRRLMGFLMIGNWGETPWDVMKTWHLVATTNMETAFSVCQPFPGSEFYRRVTEAGYMKQPSWEDFNTTSVVTRTDKMGKTTIFALYSLSILLQFVASFRGGSPKHTVKKIIQHGLDAMRRRFRCASS